MNNKIKIIDLLNKIANGEEVPNKFKLKGFKTDLVFCYNEKYHCYDLIGEKFKNDCYVFGYSELNDEVEILEEEKKIPEKHINNYGDLIILGQQDNWLEPTIETDQKINAQLNPYVFEAINENFKDIENKIYEIIDYLKSKGK